MSLILKSIGPSVIEISDIWRIRRQFPHVTEKLQISLAASNGLESKSDFLRTPIIFKIVTKVTLIVKSVGRLFKELWGSWHKILTTTTRRRTTTTRTSCRPALALQVKRADNFFWVTSQVSAFQLLQSDLPKNSFFPHLQKNGSMGKSRLIFFEGAAGNTLAVVDLEGWNVSMLNWQVGITLMIYRSPQNEPPWPKDHI